MNHLDRMKHSLKERLSANWVDANIFSNQRCHMPSKILKFADTLCKQLLL